jgi:hypothetical protein
MSECIHGLDDDWCAICKHGPDRPAPEIVEYKFKARYDGQCPACNLPIMVGQSCARTTRGRTVHDRCIS